MSSEALPVLLSSETLASCRRRSLEGLGTTACLLPHITGQFLCFPSRGTAPASSFQVISTPGPGANCPLPKQLHIVLRAGRVLLLQITA